MSDTPGSAHDLARSVALELALPLAEELLEPLADLIAARLNTRSIEATKRTPEPPSTRQPLVDAQTLATALGVSRDTIYAHADELGGERIGDGPRGRLRFDLDRALSAWSACSTSKESQAPQTPVAAGVSAPRRRQGMGSSPELLPIRGFGTPRDGDRAYPR